MKRHSKLENNLDKFHLASKQLSEIKKQIKGLPHIVIEQPEGFATKNQFANICQIVLNEKVLPTKEIKGNTHSFRKNNLNKSLEQKIQEYQPTQIKRQSIKNKRKMRIPDDDPKPSLAMRRKSCECQLCGPTNIRQQRLLLLGVDLKRPKPLGFGANSPLHQKKNINRVHQKRKTINYKMDAEIFLQRIENALQNDDYLQITSAKMKKKKINLNKSSIGKIETVNQEIQEDFYLNEERSKSAGHRVKVNYFTTQPLKDKLLSRVNAVIYEKFTQKKKGWSDIKKAILLKTSSVITFRQIITNRSSKQTHPVASKSQYNQINFDFNEWKRNIQQEWKYESERKSYYPTLRNLLQPISRIKERSIKTQSSCKKTYTQVSNSNISVNRQLKMNVKKSISFIKRTKTEANITDIKPGSAYNQSRKSIINMIFFQQSRRSK